MKSTHEEHIILPSIGSAFITGVPDKCDHDTNARFFTLANGETLAEAKFRCPTEEATQEYARAEAEKRGTHINGETSGCSKCGKAFSLQQLMGDAYWI